MELKTDINRLIEKYFKEINLNTLKASSWRVPIGGGYYDHKEVIAVLNCYLNGELSIQNSVKNFEDNYSKYLGVKYGIAVNSGTSANILALNTLIESGDLAKGDCVAIPATTFISVATPIIQLGLKPVYIDIDPLTLNMDITQLRNRDDIKCVMIVHTLGCPADMEALMKISYEKGFKIIEDCCESHGASINGKKVGSFGHLSTWSFYVAHNMTTAEGGMINTNEEEYFKICRELREFGRDKEYSGKRYGFTSETMNNFDERYTFRRVGWNFRMADAPAAFGNEQLKKLDEMNHIRISNAKYLLTHLKSLQKHFQLPPDGAIDFHHTYYSFALVIKKESNLVRQDLVLHLEDNGIETRAIMCGTLPDQPALVHQIGESHGNLENSRYVKDNGFFIGCHPMLGKDEMNHIITVLKNYCGRAKTLD